MKKKLENFGALLVLIIFGLAFFGESGLIDIKNTTGTDNSSKIKEIIDNTVNDIADTPIAVKNVARYDDLAALGPYKGVQDIEMNEGRTYFYSPDYEDMYDDKGNLVSFEKYSELDDLGRAGEAIALIGTDLLPEEERGSIGMIKPSGWNQKRYDDLIKDKYLYNRCHLIAYSLSGENANEKNLITCTRQTNIGKMLDIEMEVLNYVKNTGNHVLYRTTPYYEGDNLVATGILIEAQSVEDTEIEICYFIYNVQDGIEINYSDGDSWEIGG